VKHVIIGTAGHVDHGKTTLIKALTGTDTDRLKEEQERGMTIDLGFAALTLPDGTPAGIVDVPGHERFLKNMLAGAGGVDVVLLVIAADESVMPQTKEHLDILRLLDVKNGVVALTKADMVDPDWLEVVEDDVRGQLEGTFLEEAPIIRVNSLKGTGIPELKKALLSAVSRTEQKNTAIPFRLPVDRVFTRPGFGTVITGTLVAGTMRVGDSVEVLPKELSSRVRGLHSHGKKQETVEAGTRVAVNLAGVETEELERGALLVAPGTLAPTQLFDATLRLLPEAPKELKNRARVRVYLGTAEILGRVQIIGVEQLEPGKHAYVQFRAEEPFACARGDRFVVRSYSPMRTIGGGVVLDAAPGRHKRMDPSVVNALAAKERGTPDDLLETWLRGAPSGAMIRDAGKGAGLSEVDVQAALTTLQERSDVVRLDRDRVIHRTALSTATDRALNSLATYHTANPLRPGMPKEELRGALGRTVDPKAFAALLHYWQSEGRVTTDQTSVRRADFQVELNPRQQALLERVAAIYRDAKFNVPSLEEVSEDVGAPPDAIAAMIRVGQDQGLFAKIAEGLYYHRDTLDEAKRIVREQIGTAGSITVSQFRDITGSSRKYALPVMEYFDAVKFTRRRGDERILFEP
jgi:selenocysteine-specific elongation factor